MAARVFQRQLLLLLLLLLGGGTRSGWAWRAGSGSRTVLPTVNGTTDYWTALPDTDATSAGTFVLEWDVGRISVGNGDVRSHWVRDDIRTSVAAVEGDDGTILIFSSTEVYMIFEPDLEEYYARVRAAVAPEIAARLRFLAHGQHNHEGPDTSGLGGPVNRDFQEYMYRQMADATVEAIRTLEPAALHYGTFKHQFGLYDRRDPRVLDTYVKVLRALPAGNPSASPIFTLVQWTMHPEVTLSYYATVPPEDCIALGRDPNDPNECHARGQFFTGDFPGILRRVLQELDGSKSVVYYNGGVGSQIGPGGDVWEITDEHPLGDGVTVPPGATIVPKSFRKAFLIGQQLAIQVAAFRAPYEAPSSAIEFRQTRAYSRLTNVLFRAGLCPASAIGGDPTKPAVMGYNLRKLFICTEPASDATCVDDGFGFESDPLPMRLGTFAQMVIMYARLGPVQFIAMPGEFSPELAIGVPSDFDLPESTSKYFLFPDLHPVGPAYTFPGTIYAMANCSNTGSNMCIVGGLTGDEMGYVFPICDWRLACVADEQDCLADHEKGAMTYHDSMSGEECEIIVSDLDAARERYTQLYGPLTANRVLSACVYGQLKQAEGSGQHYEEVMSGGWNGADDYFDALASLLSVPPTGRYQID